MNMDDKDILVPVCANCGKEGDKNTCSKCNMVKYCNAVWKKVHKKKHKKECEEYVKLAAENHNEELRLAAEKHDIELFKETPSQYGDCPICFERLPILETGRYKTCCGKTICSGCVYAPVYDNQGNVVAEKTCAFCRTPTPTHEEMLEREKKRVELDDPIAKYNLGIDYRDGTCGYPKDYKKALELWHRAGELGYAKAYNNIGSAYDNGQGVERDKKNAVHYYELAAMGGDVSARYNLGFYEICASNKERALKHFMIATRGGDADSLNAVQKMYSKGYATKEDYTKALQAYQEYLGEIKSAQRDEAAAFSEKYRYY